MHHKLTPELIQEAVEQGEARSIDAVVRLLTPIIQANVAATLIRRRVEARGRELRQEVEDLTQDVFERLLAERGRLLLAWQPERGSAETFFGLIARRWVHNTLDSRRRNPWTEDPVEQQDLDWHHEPGTDLERLISSRQALRELGARLLRDLNERDQRLFELLYVRQLDDAIVREKLGITRDALYQARARLLKRLRKLVAEPPECLSAVEMAR